MANGYQGSQQPYPAPPHQGLSYEAKTIITVITLVTIYPVGLFLMFRWMKWPVWAKFLVTLPGAFILLGLVIILISIAGQF